MRMFIRAIVKNNLSVNSNNEHDNDEYDDASTSDDGNDSNKDSNSNDDWLDADIEFLEAEIARRKEAKTEEIQIEMTHEENVEWQNDSAENFYDDNNGDNASSVSENEASSSEENSAALLSAKRVKKYAQALIHIIKNEKLREEQYFGKIRKHLHDVYKTGNLIEFFISVRVILSSRFIAFSKRKNIITHVLLHPLANDQETPLDIFFKVCKIDESINIKLLDMACRSVLKTQYSLATKKIANNGWMKFWLEETNNLEAAFEYIFESRCFLSLQKLCEWRVSEKLSHREECYVDILAKTYKQDISLIFRREATPVLFYLLTKYPKFIIEKLSELQEIAQKECFNTVIKNCNMTLILELFYALRLEEQLLYSCYQEYKLSLNTHPGKQDNITIKNKKLAIQAIAEKGNDQLYLTLKATSQSEQEKKTKKFIEEHAAKSENEVKEAIAEHLRGITNIEDKTIAIEALITSPAPAKFAKPLVEIKDDSDEIYIYAHFKRVEEVAGVEAVVQAPFSSRYPVILKALTTFTSKNEQSFYANCLEQKRRVGTINNFIPLVLKTRCDYVVTPLLEGEKSDLQGFLEEAEDIEQACITIIDSQVPDAIKALVDLKISRQSGERDEKKCSMDFFVEKQRNKKTSLNDIKTTKKSGIEKIFQVRQVTKVPLAYLLKQHPKFVVDQLMGLKNKDIKNCFDNVMTSNVSIETIADLIFVVSSDSALLALAKKSYRDGKERSPAKIKLNFQMAKDAIEAVFENNFAPYRDFKAKQSAPKEETKNKTKKSKSDDKSVSLVDNNKKRRIDENSGITANNSKHIKLTAEKAAVSALLAPASSFASSSESVSKGKSHKRINAAIHEEYPPVLVQGEGNRAFFVPYESAVNKPEHQKSLVTGNDFNQFKAVASDLSHKKKPKTFTLSK